jgi:hypothetical protein
MKRLTSRLQRSNSMFAFPTPERAPGLTINIGLAKPGGICRLLLVIDLRLRIFFASAHSASRSTKALGADGS